MQRLAVIGGSGLDRWGKPSRQHEASTRYGAASAPIAVFELGATELLFLPRHGSDHALAPHLINYRANIAALAALEPDAVVAVNAVGAIAPDHAPGARVLPDQLIDYSYGRDQSFFDGEAGPLAHVEFAEPFSAALCQQLLQAARQAQIDLYDGGCLAVTQGPRLETAAEVGRLGRDGNTLVGMTSMPEAALAREVNLPYVCIAVVANAAAGLGETITQASIEQVLDAAMNETRRLLVALTD